MDAGGLDGLCCVLGTEGRERSVPAQAAVQGWTAWRWAGSLCHSAVTGGSALLQIYHGGVLEFCIITADENECNWMMFVRRAR